VRTTGYCNTARSLSAGDSKAKVLRDRPLSGRDTLTLASAVPCRASLSPERNEDNEKSKIGGSDDRLLTTACVFGDQLATV
jgi:hypothetical protein